MGLDMLIESRNQQTGLRDVKMHLPITYNQ
jgi:hypothetical protein